MKNKIFLKILTLVLVVCTIAIFTGCTKDDEIPTHDDALTSKVVLFIGDGMGPNHIYNTELYYEESMYFSSFSVKTTVDTNSLSGLTDSAAAATAMATGVRVKNEKIAIDGSTAIVSITELAKRDQYGAGVITSDEITGATPSGFSAHAKSRNNSAEILLSQKDSSIDLLLGAGSYSSSYEGLFQEKGWNWVKTYDQLSTEKKRFVATFENVGCENGTSSEPTLTELASFAIDYMEANYPTGYFLMIEGAKIDKESSNGNVTEMMKNQLDFSNAVKTVDQKLSATGSAYSLIVTADHETGGLQKANSKAEITDDLYTTTNHTDTKVNLYFKSTLTTAPSILGGESILNTDIFLLCKELLAIK